MNIRCAISMQKRSLLLLVKQVSLKIENYADPRLVVEHFGYKTIHMQNKQNISCY